jgi:hypothetical protein
MTTKEFKKTAKIDTKVLLSTLWIVVSLTMAYGDILTLFIPGGLEEMEEFAGEIPIPQLMLFGALTAMIPITMILLSRVLKYRANRWANIIISAIKIVLVIALGSTNPHYIFLATIEVVCMLLIIWNAWKWPNPEA